MAKVAEKSNVQPAPEFIGKFEIAGVTYHCLKGTGVHFNKVSKLIEGDLSQFYPTLAHFLLRIEREGGEGGYYQKAPFDYENLDWQDYTKLLNEMTELGFTLS